MSKVTSASQWQEGGQGRGEGGGVFKGIFKVLAADQQDIHIINRRNTVEKLANNFCGF